MTSYQHKLIEKENAHKNHLFLDNTKGVTSMDKLSIDLREDQHKEFALLNIRYRNNESFIRFSLLHFGNIELNHGPH